MRQSASPSSWEGCQGRSQKAAGEERRGHILSVFMIGSMRSHALRKRLCAPVLDATNNAAVVENMIGG
jgi:hypothetical protein